MIEVKPGGKVLLNGEEQTVVSVSGFTPEMQEVKDAVTNKDGSFTVTREDGSTLTVKPKTGQSIEEYPNGSKITMNADGNAVVLGPDKTKSLQLNDHLIYCRTKWEESHTEKPPIFVTEDDKVVWLNRRERKMREAANRRALKKKTIQDTIALKRTNFSDLVPSDLRELYTKLEGIAPSVLVKALGDTTDEELKVNE